MRLEHFRSLPSHQNALDIFEGEWSASMPVGSGLRAGNTAAEFYSDIRIDWARQWFGGFEGRKILEIGPLEAGQTYTMCRMGAGSVLAIDSNPRAFLKCLIIKEIFGLSAAHFMLGDAVEYVRETTETFDICIASGILYHLRDPIGFLEAASRRSDRLFLWTHYYDFDCLQRLGLERKRFRRREVSLTARGETFTGYRHTYPDARNPLAIGGMAEWSCWLPRPEIERALRLFGFTLVGFAFEDTAHPHGPCLAICASR